MYGSMIKENLCKFPLVYLYLKLKNYYEIYNFLTFIIIFFILQSLKMV